MGTGWAEGDVWAEFLFLLGVLGIGCLGCWQLWQLGVGELGWVLGAGIEHHVTLANQLTMLSCPSAWLQWRSWQRMMAAVERKRGPRRMTRVALLSPIWEMPCCRPCSGSAFDCQDAQHLKLLLPLPAVFYCCCGCRRRQA